MLFNEIYRHAPAEERMLASPQIIAELGSSLRGSWHFFMLLQWSKHWHEHLFTVVLLPYDTHSIDSGKGGHFPTTMNGRDLVRNFRVQEMRHATEWYLSYSAGRIIQHRKSRKEAVSCCCSCKSTHAQLPSTGNTKRGPRSSSSNSSSSRKNQQKKNVHNNRLNENIMGSLRCVKRDVCVTSCGHEWLATTFWGMAPVITPIMLKYTALIHARYRWLIIRMHPPPGLEYSAGLRRFCGVSPPMRATRTI